MSRNTPRRCFVSVCQCVSADAIHSTASSWAETRAIGLQDIRPSYLRCTASARSNCQSQLSALQFAEAGQPGPLTSTGYPPVISIARLTPQLCAKRKDQRSCQFAASCILVLDNQGSVHPGPDCRHGRRDGRLQVEEAPFQACHLQGSRRSGSKTAGYHATTRRWA